MDVNPTLIAVYLVSAIAFQLCLAYFISHRATVVLKRKLEKGEFDAIITCFMNKHGKELIGQVLDVAVDRVSAAIEEKLMSLRGSLMGTLSGKSRARKKEEKMISQAILAQGSPMIAEAMNEYDIPGLNNPMIAQIVAPYIAQIEQKAMERVAQLQNNGQNIINKGNAFTNSQQVKSWLENRSNSPVADQHFVGSADAGDLQQ